MLAQLPLTPTTTMCDTKLLRALYAKTWPPAQGLFASGGQLAHGHDAFMNIEMVDLPGFVGMRSDAKLRKHLLLMVLYIYIYPVLVF